MRSQRSARGVKVLVVAMLVMTGWRAALAQEGKMVLTTTSDDALRAYREGVLLLDRSQPERARPLLEEAIALDPNFVMAYEALARSSPTLKDVRAAFQKMQDVAGQAPMSAGERLYCEAVFAILRGDNAVRLQKLEELAGMYPDDERVMYQLGLAHYGTDDEAAVRIFQQALSINPSFVPVYNRMGYSLRALGKSDQAESAFEKAIELDPENPNAYDSYAELLLKLGRFEESIASYRAALEREPLFPSAQIGVAANLILQDKHEEAREGLQSLYAIAPHDGIRSGIHWALAVTYADEEDLDKALAQLQENFELSEKNEDSAAMEVDLRNIGAVLMEAGDYDEAAAAFDAAMDVIVKDANQDARRMEFSRAFHAYGLGVVAAQKGDFQQANERAAELDELAKSLGAELMERLVHELKGIIWLEQDEFTLALSELRQANDTEVYNMYRIALAYEGMGNVEQARKMAEYVVTYNSPLNFNYAFVRHDAANKLESLR